LAHKEEMEMKAASRWSPVLIIVGLIVVLSFPGLTGAAGGGANVVRGDECTISLVEVGGGDVTTTDTRSVETSSGNLIVKCRADLPDDVDPPARAVRTNGELCTTHLGPTMDTQKVVTPAGKVRLTCRINGSTRPPATGWAIGDDATGTAVIVHTADGGLTWHVQGDSTAWAGLGGDDVSAVDDQTVWVALSSGDAETGGAILHTTDGGATWISQAIPAGLAGGIKGVKGLSRNTAWAASLRGTILHTIDGGATWTVVPHPAVPIFEVNRMDAMGAHVWIADVYDGFSVGGSVVHTRDGGLTWRAEYLPEDSPLTVHAFSPTAAWASGAVALAFFRTVDGGEAWDKVVQLGGHDHMDDICAAGADDVWGVQNGGGVDGRIWRVHVAAGGTPDARNITPPELGGYAPGGITCLDTGEAWAVAQQQAIPDTSKPLGIILHTVDGENWVQQSAPTHVYYWKMSFAGARR
jgi:photosystem II stability/assembly factor-like uncharacterized protein